MSELIPSVKHIKNITHESLATIGNPKKLKHSNFYLTMNTNKPMDISKESDVAIIHRFEESIHDIFSHVPNYINIMGEGGYDNETFKDINVQFCTELGPKTLLLHTHLVILVSHYTAIRLDYKKLRVLVCEANGLNNIYMNNIVIRGSNNLSRLEDYLTKNMHVLKN